MQSLPLLSNDLQDENEGFLPGKRGLHYRRQHADRTLSYQLTFLSLTQIAAGTTFDSSFFLIARRFLFRLSTMLHAKSTALEVTQTLRADLSGKVVLITGGTAGNTF